MTPSEVKPVPLQAQESFRPFVHIRELDGVRGIAAIAVFFHHVCFTKIHPFGWGPIVLGLRWFSKAGEYGVDLFFVLSGFLITSLLLRDRKSPAYYQDFYWKRVLRIAPVYVLCLIAVFFMVPGSGRYLLLSALFLVNFAQLFHVPGTVGPFWTLAIEEQFYLIWPTVVRRRMASEVQRWAVVIGLSAAILRFASAPFHHYNYFFTFYRCDGLAFGAFLACWFFRHDSAAAKVKLAKALSLLLVLGVLCLLIACFLCSSLAFMEAWRQTGVALVCGPSIGLVILSANARPLGFLRSGVLPFFGLISYALYMTHSYVLLKYDQIRGPLVPGDNVAYVIRFVAVLGLSLALCLFSRYCIELPVMSLRRYVLRRPAVHRPTDAPIPLGNL